jgi:hypothetical protein
MLSSDQIPAELVHLFLESVPAELIQEIGEPLLFAILKLINSVWNKKELPNQWKEFLIVRVHKKSDKTDCNNYRGISLHTIFC